MLYEILSLLPFISIIYLLLIKDFTAYKTMVITFFLTFIEILYFWNIDFQKLVMISFKGFFMALEIFLIIFSILLVFNLLKSKKKLDVLEKFFKEFTEDKNILIILVGFFLVTFIEAIAGFGTPAAIIGPILVFLGIRPLTAVIITLISDSIAVTFGAFGIPIVFGIGSIIEKINLSLITYYSGIIGFVLSIIAPFILLSIYNHLENKNWRLMFNYKKLCIVSGLSFGIVFLISAIYLTAELVSVLASVIGLMSTLIYLKFFVIRKKIKYNIKELVLATLPYIFIIFLLIVSRINLFNLGNVLKSFSLDIYLLKDIKFTTSFYSPGFLILFIFFISLLVYKIKSNELKEIIIDSFSKSYIALLTLLFTLGFVQIIIYSANNNQNILGIPEIIATMFSKTGDLYIIISPFIGAFGAFISGSATVSNLIFSNIQYEMSKWTSYSPELILSLQALGGSAGNLIAIHNIVAAISVVGLRRSESKIIKINLLVVFGYCLIASMIAYLIHILI